MLSAWFLPESTGDRWSMEQYSDRKALEKIRKFSGRNTASAKSPELPGTGWTVQPG
jgi:hypothetical protein